MTDPAPFSNKDWIRVARATGRRWLEAHLPQIIAYRDICRGEKHRNTFGGPCNGQRKRCEMIKDLMGTCAFLATVETGTFRGDTTEFLARCTEQPIFSVEVCAYLYHYARHRLRRFNHVHLVLGDSRTVLQRLLKTPTFPKRRILFYLDAHWYPDWPIREEVALIENSCAESVIIIDDFQVPDDPGYQYQDEGEGYRMCLDHLGPALLDQLAIFWPSAPAASETGARRGAVILVTKDALVQKVKALDSLRQL